MSAAPVPGSPAAVGAVTAATADALLAPAGARAAVSWSGGAIDYDTLDRLSRGGAAHLAERGVATDECVAVVGGDTRDRVLAMLAVWRAGGAYLPLDERDPLPRLRQVVAESGARLAVAGAGAEVEGLGVPAVPVEALAEPPPAARCAPALPSSRAYVVYTSGSTGLPKGVEIEHRNLVASTSDRLAYERQPGRVLVAASPAFDAWLGGVCWALAVGGTLVHAPPEAVADAAALAEAVAASACTHLVLPPSLYAALLAEVDGGEPLASLEAVVMGGERCSPSLVERHRELLPGRPLLSEYGASEATVFSTAVDLAACGPAERADLLRRTPIGQPLAGDRLFLVDAALRAVDDGVEGELCIAGAGVGRGFLGQPALTAEQFVPDPHGAPGTRCYRTGDRGVREDGRWWFLGRFDEQVKVRGHRVEPAEVEQALLRAPGVRRCAVVLRGIGDRRQGLVAFCVAAEGRRLSAAAVREHATAELPAYMVPARVVTLPQLPLNRNGKIDRGRLRELPLPDESRAGAVTPAAGLEATVAGVWAQVLEVDAVGRDENLFHRGADSLSIAAAVRRLEEVTGVRLDSVEVFARPTVAEIAALVAARRPRGPAAWLRRVTGGRRRDGRGRA